MPGRSTRVTRRLSRSKTSILGDQATFSGGANRANDGQRNDGHSSNARSSSDVICRSIANGSRAPRVGTSVLCFFSDINPPVASAADASW